MPRASLGADTLLGLAQTQRRTLCLAKGLDAVSTASSWSESTMILNSPYHTTGTTNAVGFDKFMAFYSKCFVVGARIVTKGAVTVVGVASTIVGLTITTNATSLGSTEAAIENGLSEHAAVWKNPDRFQFNLGVDVKKFLNKRNVIDDAQLFTTTASQPSQLIVAHFWNQARGSTTSTAEAYHEIYFDCIFTDPIPFT